MGHLVLVVQVIKNDDLRPLVHFFLKKPHCPNFGSMFQSSESTYILLSLYGVWYIDPKFGHWQGFKKNLKVQDKPAPSFVKKNGQNMTFTGKVLYFTLLYFTVLYCTVLNSTKNMCPNLVYTVYSVTQTSDRVNLKHRNMTKYIIFFIDYFKFT